MDILNWDDILEDIEEQRAVLLIGHHFLPHAHEELNRQLREKLKDKLRHFHRRDGLFLFKDSDAKTTAQQVTARFYKSNAPDDDILKKVVEMPFRLMISANPDKSLVNAFARYKQRLQFDYFSCNNKEREYKIERPSEENPLLYNLCGSVEDQESLILDYDDLFKMLKTLLPDIKVPNEIRSPLMKTTTYIFVGFHFERWYTQLFLRYLNMNDNQFSNNSRNYVLDTKFEDSEMEQFFMQQFDVKFIGADWSFFEEMHQRFAQKYPNRFRKVVEQLSPTATTISQLVAKSEFGSAFSMLKIFGSQLDQDDLDMLAMTEGAYSQYVKDKAEGIVLNEHLSSALARVRKNILDLSKKLS